jgi:hypothetical protein
MSESSQTTMNCTTNDVQMPPSKLADLEARSDQERIGFLRAEMATAFTFTGLARAQYEREQDAEHYVADAEKAYSTLVRFTSDPKHIEHVPPEVKKNLGRGWSNFVVSWTD